MKNIWYADKRDLIKWGALIHLAKQFKCTSIIQVAFLREESRPKLRIESEKKKELLHLPESVWNHFRDIKAAEQIKDGVTICVYAEEMKNRSEYLAEIKKILGSHRERKVVLLDIDTGITETTPKSQHISLSEVADILDVLKRNDIIVLYQHSQRDKKWCEKMRDVFSKACNGRKVITVTEERTRPGVAFFAVKK